MQEGHAPPVSALSWRVVDETQPGSATLGYRSIEVGHAEANMMNAGPAPVEELGYRAVGVLGLEEFEGRLTEREADDGRAVCRLGGAGHEAEDVSVEGQGAGDAGNRDADVGDARPRVHHTAKLTEFWRRSRAYYGNGSNPSGGGY